MKAFEKKVFGKWVLSGEHSVLRGCPALVFPLPCCFIEFSYWESDQPLSVQKEGVDLAGLDFSAAPLLEKALSLAGKTREDLRGRLKIKSQMPFGAGLGASAALCAGLALLFENKSWLEQPTGCPSKQAFAQSLEDLFHGKSSGMDVAQALKGQALLYQNGKIRKFLPPFRRRPNLFLSYSGRRSATILAAAQVKDLLKKDPQTAALADKDMARASDLCLSAISSESEREAEGQLREGLDLGRASFQKWGLLSYDLEKHISDLKAAGSLAAKPTGSGLGGYVISLWGPRRPPPAARQMISLEI